MPPRPFLLVDDDETFRSRLARALAARGAATVIAPDPAAAVAAVREQLFAGVVTDLRMPGTGGLGLVRELLMLRPELPVVILTGFGSIATALEAVRLGARDYLTKPADPDLILAALRGERAPRPNPKDVPPEVPSLGRVEWEHIERVLAESGGNISQAARMLGLNRRTLQRKLGKYPPPR